MADKVDLKGAPEAGAEGAYAVEQWNRDHCGTRDGVTTTPWAVIDADGAK